MIEIACKDLVFHYNKKNLEDPTVPMWVCKTKGKSYYINHMTSKIPWTTKETPDNESTKGSIKFKNCLLTIDVDNNATLSILTSQDKERLRTDKKTYARIIIEHEYYPRIKRYMDDNNMEYAPFRRTQSRCGGYTYYITDIDELNDLTLLALAFSNNEYRVLQPNEEYYKWYDEHREKGLKPLIIARGDDDKTIDFADEDDEVEDE